MLAVTVMPINPKSKKSFGWKFDHYSCLNLTGEELANCLEEAAYTTHDIFYLTVNNTQAVLTTNHTNQTITAKPVFLSMRTGLPQSLQLEPGVISQDVQLSLHLAMRDNISSFVTLTDPKLQFDSINPDAVPKATIRLDQRQEILIVYLQVGNDT